MPLVVLFILLARVDLVVIWLALSGSKGMEKWFCGKGPLGSAVAQGRARHMFADARAGQFFSPAVFFVVVGLLCFPRYYLSGALLLVATAARTASATCRRHDTGDHYYEAAVLFNNI